MTRTLALLLMVASAGARSRSPSDSPAPSHVERRPKHGPSAQIRPGAVGVEVPAGEA